MLSEIGAVEVSNRRWKGRGRHSEFQANGNHSFVLVLVCASVYIFRTYQRLLKKTRQGKIQQKPFFSFFRCRKVKSDSFINYCPLNEKRNHSYHFECVFVIYSIWLRKLLIYLPTYTVLSIRHSRMFPLLNQETKQVGIGNHGIFQNRDLPTC